MSKPSMQPIGVPQGVEGEEQRQPLDIAKEFFTEQGVFTKSNLNGREIVTIAKALWFAGQYGILEIPILINDLLLLKRSEGALALKSFKESIKEMKPSFEQKDGGGQLL